MLKYLAWGLGLIVLFAAAMGGAYVFTHHPSPAPVAMVVPTPIPTMIIATPTPTPDVLSQASDNPFDTSADYSNPFDDTSYQNPF